jgi:hypothetical protein
MKASKLLMVNLPEEEFTLLCTHAGRISQTCGSCNPQFTTTKYIFFRNLSFGGECQNNALILGFQVLGPGWAAITQKCGSWTVPMA